MPINFPNSPSLNQQYTYDSKTWEWNGIYWEVYSALTSYITSAYTVGNGYSDISGVTGGNIALKSFSGVNINIIDGGDKLTFSGNSGNITGGGTTNYVPKWTGGTGLGDSLIYDDGTNVGIGTSSPSSKLDINVSTGGTIGVRISGDSSSDMLRVTQTGSGNAIIVEDSSNPDSTPFVVASDGRVGIGITSPLSSYKLHVRNGTATNSAAASGTVATFEGSGATYVTVLSPDTSNSGFAFGSNSDRFGAFAAWNYNNNQFSFNTDKTGGFITFSTDQQTERMRIDSSGNVGIGTTSPSAKLDINVSTGGTIGVRISGDSSSDMLRITQTGSGNAILVEDSLNPDSTPFVVTSGGTVGIGTTTPSYFLEAISTGGVDAVMMFDGGTAANANLVSRADTTQKLPVIVMSDRNNAYSILTSFYIALDRASGASWSTLFTSRNDAIYVNNYTDKGHHFVTANSGGTKAVRMSILGSGNVGIGTTSPLTTLDVRGATRLSASTGTSLTVISSGNSTSSPVFSVQGSQGELFSVTDSLTGSLFSVSDISGLPIMEVFSDSTTIIGDYQAPSLYTTKRVSSITATTGTTIYSFPTSAYTSSFVDYNVSGSTGLRAGNIMAIWSGSSVNFTETSTNDIGNTTPLTFGYVMSGSSAVLQASASTGTWIVKSIVRGL